MNGKPLLSTLARVLQEHGLEAILLGNAAAALNGTPVTTIDLYFLFRKTPENLRKLRAVAKSLGATIWRPVYPVSSFRRRLSRDDLLEIDFMTETPRVKSFASLRRRARRVDFDGYTMLVEDLRDIINSSRMGDRPQDRPVPSLSAATLDEKRRKKPDALRVATERAQREQIRRWLRLPPNERTHFLRKRIGIQASCL